jgi:hypothetical protein
MRSWLSACWLVLCPAAAWQNQETAAPAADAHSEAVRWAAGLAGRMRDLRDPVAAIWGQARVGALLCADDPASASAIFRQAIESLGLLPGDAFSAPVAVLPVASFSGLWGFVVRAGVRCDPALGQYLDANAARKRMEEERRAANGRISEALERISDNPDRAAQIAAGALEAADPDAFDMEAGVKFLAKLRARAPDLADELFPRALALIQASRAPGVEALMQLGAYLFTSPRLLETDDADMRGDLIQMSGVSYPQLTAVRHSANPDEVASFIDACIALMRPKDNPGLDVNAAYILGSEMLQAARDSAPDAVEPLQAAMAGLGYPQPAPGIQGAASAARGAMSRIFAAIAGERFEEARSMLADMSDPAVRGEAGYLIDFAEASRDVRKKETGLALHLANSQRPGIKRALLYAAVVAGGAGRAVALSSLHLALRDVQLLPAEQQACVLSALASATLPVDRDNAFTVIALLIDALNAADANPRRGRFDPQSLRAVFSRLTDTSTDSALIACGARGAYEVVDGGSERRSFNLRAGAVGTFTLPAFIERISGGIDFDRLEAYVLSLRDETRRAAALAALADVRLKQRGVQAGRPAVQAVSPRE